MKINAYKFQKEAIPYYQVESNKYGFEINFIQDDISLKNLKNLDNDVDAIIVSHISKVSKEMLEIMKEKGIKYLVTASAGFNHIDLETATKLDYKIGRVPAYSPTAVASWAFTSGLSLLRKTNLMFAQTVNYDFTIKENILAKEFKELTVGIIGTGRIGYETAKYFHSVGFKVLGYDQYINENAKEILTYVDLDTLLKESDLISLHMNFVEGNNNNFINDETIKKMKHGVCLVNSARAGLVDSKAVERAINSGHIWGFANDVLNNEGIIIGEHWTEETLKKHNSELVDLINLYPKVLVSPHVAYFTTEALQNMAERTILNLKQLSETGTCDTVVN